MSTRTAWIWIAVLIVIVILGCSIAFAAFRPGSNPVVIPTVTPTATFIVAPTIPWQPTATPFPRLKPTPLPTWAGNVIGNG